MHHAHSEPTPPSLFTEIDVPAALDRLILACLEKDPARRPESAEALGLELAVCVEAGSWTREMAQHWWETHRPKAEEPSDGLE